MNEEQFDRIKSLLTKHLLSELNEQEATELNKWRESSIQNEELYNRVSSKEYLNKRYKDFMNVIFHNGSSNTDKGLFNNSAIYMRSIFRNRVIRRFAAIIVIGLVTVLSVYQITSEIRKKQSLNKLDDLMAVTLRIDGAKAINLETIAVNTDIENFCTKIDKNTLKYYPQSKENLSTHEINIPEVMLYKVILPDGSAVWLNSKSTLSYPASFKSDSRTVSLDGEGYFDITKDISRPFKVIVNGMSINVTGTQFNVKAYKEDKNISATLVEGKICIDYKNKLGSEQIYKLKKGEQSVLNKENGNIDVKEVNTSIYTSWREGIYFFDKQRLEDIMKDLERWYGLDVVFIDKNAKNRILSGKLNRKEKPEELLNIFARMMPGHIKIEEKTVTIY